MPQEFTGAQRSDVGSLRDRLAARTCVFGDLEDGAAMERGRLHGLDALRGIAALMVFWHHVQAEYHLQIVQVAAVSAVDIFFALSGFVVARTYEVRLQSGEVSPSRFMLMRYRRLWATAALGSVIGLLGYSASHGLAPINLAALVAILIFMPFSLNGLFALNVPLWSLSCEVLSNLLHCTVFARFNLATAGIGFGATLLFVGSSIWLGTTAWGISWFALLLAAIRAVVCYLIGIMIWRLWGDCPLPFPPLVAVALFPALLLLGPHLPAAAFLIGFALIGAPILLRSAVGLGPSRWAAWTGAISYPLYAVHVPVLKVSKMMGLSVAGAMVSCLLLAALVTLLVELPRRPAENHERGKAAVGRV